MHTVSATSAEQLKQENARLLALVSWQENTLQQQKTTIESLTHQLHLFRHARFGRKSEKGVGSTQLELQFDEAQLTTEPELPIDEAIQDASKTQTITYTRAKKGTGRKPLPKSLPYVERVYDISDVEKQCPCGCALTHIGNDTTEQLDVVPQMTFRVIHIRKKYACKNCEETIISAKLPKQPIDKSMAAPGLLAAVIDSKFNRHMPLYRQEAMFVQAGVSVSRATLGNWLIKSAALLTPLIKLMEADVHDYDVAFADETPLQVLKEKNRPATSKSYMWLFIGGPPDKRAFIYQYHQTRSHKIPAQFLVDFKGYLQADCYGAYVQLGKLPYIKHVACLAHARRYFVDVTKLSKKKGLAHQVVQLMAKLYHLESQLKAKEATADMIYEQRQQYASPIFDQLKKRIDDNLNKLLPKSPLGTAMHYLLTHWHALKRYLDDGRLEIDNNRSERSIKPFVIGRKNWLFHGNDIGANAGATLFSFIETCKYHKIEPFSWFKYVLTHIHQAQTIEQLQALLPYHINTTLLDDMKTLPKLIVPDKSGVD